MNKPPVSKRKQRITPPSLTIPLAFLVIGTLWVLFADMPLENMAPSLVPLFRGLFLVFCTTVFLLFLLRQLRKKISNLATQNDELFSRHPSPMWIFDTSTFQILDVNQGAIDLYGYTREEFLRKTIFDIRPIEDVGMLKDQLVSSRPGYHQSGIWRHLKKDGSQIYVEVFGHTTEFDSKEAVMVLIHDVTRMIETENKLRETNEALENIVRQRTSQLTSLNETLLDKNRQTESANTELVRVNEQLQQANKKISAQAEIILKQKDEQLNRFLQALNDAVWSVDLTGNGDDYISHTAEERYGISRDALRTRPFFWVEKIVPEDRPIHESSQKKLAATGQAESTYRIVNHDDHVRWVFTRERIIKEPGGKPLRHEGIATDITYIKQTEEIIQEQKSLLHAVFENLEMGITIVDTTGKILLYNKVAQELASTASLTMEAGTDFLDLMPPAEHTKIRNVFNQVIETRSSVHYTTPYRLDDREPHYLLVYYNPVLDAQGEVRQVCVIGRDITEQKRAAETLTEDRNLLRTLIDNIPDYVFVRDARLRHIINNKAFLQLIGAGREEDSLGKTVADYFDRSAARKSADEDQKILSTGTPLINQEEELLDRTGKMHWLLTTKVPLKDEQGNIKGLVGISRDITERKEMELALIEKQYILQKAQHVANIGHWTALLNKGEYEISCSPEVFIICGIDKSSFDGSLEASIRLVHEDDRDYVLNAFNETVSGRQSFHVDHRVVRPDGSIRWVHQQADISYDAEKKPVSLVGVIQDITDRKNAELKIKEYAKTLHTSNERYRLASIATDDAIWDWDLKTGDRFWGEGFQTLFGYDLNKEKLNINSWTDHIHPEDVDRVLKHMKEVVSSPTTQKWEDEYRYLQADGSYANVVDRGFIIRDDANNPVRMIGAMQDATERTLSIEKIRNLSLVASKTDSLVVIINKDFQTEWVNEAFTRLTGYSLEETASQKFYRLMQGEETDPYTVERIERRLQRGESVSEEILSYGKQGKKFWLRMNINPIFNEEGVIDKYISIQTDITAQKEYERGITAMARELANIIEYANAPIFGFDKQGYIDEWNEVCFTITGFVKGEVYGKKIINLLIAESHQEEVNGILASVLSGKSISNYELPIITRDHRRVIILLNVTPRWNSMGQIAGALAIGQDVTELTEYRRSLEEKVQERTHELNEALKTEKELADMKNRFVAIASHEFRTPLSTINFSAGFIRKYKNKISEEELDKKLTGIERQVQHMTFLLDDILTLGKSDAGAIQVKSSVVNIRAFLEKTIEEVANAHHNSHRIDLNMSLPQEEIESDEKILRNVFVNLLSNAIKFSPGTGSVEVRGEMENGYVVVRVKDCGIGIPQEDLKKVFEPFHRGTNVSTIQGTGLGLSIVKKAVDLLKGQIEVSSQPGQGTTFTVKIPVHNG